MNGILGKLLRGGAIYGVASVLSRISVLILLPLYTYYLTPSQFGLLHIAMAIAAFCKLFLAFGLTTSFWKFYEGNADEKAGVLRNILFIQCMLSLFTAAPIVLCWIITGIDNQLMSTTIILFLGEVLSILFDAVLLVLRSENRPLKYTQASILYAVIFLVLSIFGLSIPGLELYGVALASTLSYFIIALVYSPFIYLRTKGRTNKATIKKMITYSYPLMFVNIISSFILLSDKFVLSMFVSSHDIGVYSFAAKLGSTIKLMLVTPFILAWNPIRWEIFRRDDGSKIMEKVFKLLIPVFLLAGTLLSCSLPSLGLLILHNDSYDEGLKISVLAGLSHIIFAIYYINTMGLLFCDKTRRILLILSTGSIVNFILSIFMTSYYGILGPPIASIFSCFGMSIAAIHCSQKYYPLDRPVSVELLGVLCAFIFSVSISYGPYWTSVLSFTLLSLTCIWISKDVALLSVVPKISNKLSDYRFVATKKGGSQ